MSATPTTREVLEKARELIATPERWTKGALARDEHGIEVPTCCDDAYCWCMGGAISAVSENGSVYRSWGVVERIVSMHIDKFNDAPERTHAEVLEAFDRAIALASTEASS